jgi:hypothetical protein
MNKLLSTRKAVKIIFWIIALIFPCFSDVSAPLLITPGYGVSDHFQLMSGKVKNTISLMPSQSQLKKEIMSLKLIRNKICLSIKENDGREQPKISMYAISGRLVYRFHNEQNGSPRTAYLFSLPKLSKGVYFVNVRYKNDQIQIKVVYTGK